MKTPEEQLAETARRSFTLVILKPDGTEMVRLDGIAGYVAVGITPGGDMTPLTNLPAPIASQLIRFADAACVAAPYAALISQAQAAVERSRIVPATALPLNGRPRLVVP